MDNLDELLKLSSETLEKMLDEMVIDPAAVEFATQRVINFEVCGLKYKCEFDESVTKSGAKILEFKFYLLNNPHPPKRNDYKSDQQYQIALKKSQVGITGTGNQFKVFSLVCSSIKKYIDQNNPDYITFTADEENRQSLYGTMLKWAMKYISNYRRVFNNPLTGNEVGKEEFWLEKYK